MKLIASALCLTANAAGVVGLTKCTGAAEQSLEPEADMTKWILGASGRLCGPHGCLSVVAGQAGMAHGAESLGAAAGVRRKFLR